jgi:hypothetical protein
VKGMFPSVVRRLAVDVLFVLRGRSTTAFSGA